MYPRVFFLLSTWIISIAENSIYEYILQNSFWLQIKRKCVNIFSKCYCRREREREKRTISSFANKYITLLYYIILRKNMKKKEEFTWYMIEIKVIDKMLNHVITLLRWKELRKKHYQFTRRSLINTLYFLCASSIQSIPKLILMPLPINIFFDLHFWQSQKKNDGMVDVDQYGVYMLISNSLFICQKKSLQKVRFSLSMCIHLNAQIKWKTDTQKCMSCLFVRKKSFFFS